MILRDATSLKLSDLPRAAAVGNTHYSAGTYANGEYAWRWTARPAPAPEEWVRVASPAEEIFVGLATASSDVDFDWRRYQGKLRLVAWAACHDYLLSLLRHKYCADFLPRSFVSSDSVARSAGAQVDFVVERIGQPIAAGTCVFPQPLPVRAAAEPPVLISALPFRIPLTVDRLTVSAASLFELQVGAAICIRQSAFLDVGARLDLCLGRLHLLVKVAGSRLIVLKVSARTTEDDMQAKPESCGAPPPNLTPVSVEELPVELRFDAGSIDVDLEELSRMQPGYVFELERPLSERTIRIIANGALIGHGELVVIGDHLGVRLTALSRAVRSEAD